MERQNTGLYKNVLHMNWKRKGRDTYIKSWEKTGDGSTGGAVLRQGSAGETQGGITQITEGSSEQGIWTEQ